MSKYLYDLSFITPETLTASIPIHSMRILRNLPEDVRRDFTVLVSPKLRKHFAKELPGIKLRKIYIPRLFGIAKWLKRLSYSTGVRLAAKDAQWIIIPDEFRDFTSMKLPLKKAIFVHDLKGMKMEQKYIDKTRIFFTEHLENADIVLPISEYTKADIIKYFPGVDPSRLHVVYNSVELSQPQEVKEVAKLKEPYILWVSALQPYKNIMTTLAAFAKIAKDIPHRLVIVGRSTHHWHYACEPFICEHGIADRITQLSDLTDGQLTWLYRHASLYVTSSTREGFGFPPIEAAMCGCPVVSSRAESLPEVTMDLLNYYEPTDDPTALANAITDTLTDPPAKAHREYIAQQFATRYTPSNQINTLLQLLNGYDDEDA